MISYLSPGQEDTLRDASRLWGKDFQKGMAIEECSELILALRHYDRKRIKIDDVLEEVADVMIVCRQILLDHMYDKEIPVGFGYGEPNGIEIFSAEDYVHHMMRYKMDRLKTRVENDEPNAKEVT